MTQSIQSITILTVICQIFISLIPSRNPQNKRRKDPRSRTGSTPRLLEDEGNLLKDHVEGSLYIFRSNCIGTSCRQRGTYRGDIEDTMSS